MFNKSTISVLSLVFLSALIRVTSAVKCYKCVSASPDALGYNLVVNKPIFNYTMSNMPARSDNCEEVAPNTPTVDCNSYCITQSSLLFYKGSWNQTPKLHIFYRGCASDLIESGQQIDVPKTENRCQYSYMFSGNSLTYDSAAILNGTLHVCSSPECNKFAKSYFEDGTMTKTLPACSKACTDPNNACASQQQQQQCTPSPNDLSYTCSASSASDSSSKLKTRKVRAARFQLPAV